MASFLPASPLFGAYGLLLPPSAAMRVEQADGGCLIADALCAIRAFGSRACIGRPCVRIRATDHGGFYLALFFEWLWFKNNWVQGNFHITILNWKRRDCSDTFVSLAYKLDRVLQDHLDSSDCVPPHLLELHFGGKIRYIQCGPDDLMIQCDVVGGAGLDLLCRFWRIIETFHPDTPEHKNGMQVPGGLAKRLRRTCHVSQRACHFTYLYGDRSRLQPWIHGKDFPCRLFRGDFEAYSRSDPEWHYALPLAPAPGHWQTFPDLEVALHVTSWMYSRSVGDDGNDMVAWSGGADGSQGPTGPGCHGPLAPAPRPAAGGMGALLHFENDLLGWAKAKLHGAEDPNHPVWRDFLKYKDYRALLHYMVMWERDEPCPELLNAAIVLPGLRVEKDAVKSFVASHVALCAYAAERDSYCWLWRHHPDHQGPPPEHLSWLRSCRL